MHTKDHLLQRTLTLLVFSLTMIVRNVTKNSEICQILLLRWSLEKKTPNEDNYGLIWSHVGWGELSLSVDCCGMYPELFLQGVSHYKDITHILQRPISLDSPHYTPSISFFLIVFKLFENISYLFHWNVWECICGGYHASTDVLWL